MERVKRCGLVGEGVTLLGGCGLGGRGVSLWWVLNFQKPMPVSVLLYCPLSVNKEVQFSVAGPLLCLSAPHFNDNGETL